MDALERAVERLRAARSLVVTAGAGMGVDSGLPDFRGPEGFWRAYPAYRAEGLRFEELANPRWFAADPTRAWGFYGHRLELYRRTRPHAGFAILRRWGERLDPFVFTSNVDGQFQRAGFDPARVLECHGAIDFLQCTRPCSDRIWSAEGVTIEVDPETFRAAEPLPRCACGALARPNVLMFGDGGWVAERTEAQEARWVAWLAQAPRPLVVIECGAGLAVPTVRAFGERLLARGAGLVRINKRDPQGPAGHVPLAMGAAEALAALDERLGG